MRVVVLVPDGGKLSTWHSVDFCAFATFSARGVVLVHDGGKLATWYSVGFVRLQHIPHVGLCWFLTTVNCQPGTLLVLHVYNIFNTWGCVGS